MDRYGHPEPYYDEWQRDSAEPIFQPFLPNAEFDQIVAQNHVVAGYGAGAFGPTQSEFFGSAAWRLIHMASVGASAYHGYKRNESIGWAIAWGLLGGLFPVITPAIAVAQGFGKKAGR